MKTEELIQVWKDRIDYLAPLQTPYEQAIYNYLFRWSYLETGNNIVRRGKRTIAVGIGRASGVGPHGSGKVSYAAVDENLKSLEKKEHIQIGDVTREGTLYTIFLPSEIKECVELKNRKEAGEPTEIDYFNVLENRVKIYERDNYECHYCGQKLTEDNITLDHIVPGGGNSKENLVTCCLECNSIKAGKTMEQAAPALLERLKQKMKRGLSTNKE